MNNRYRLPIQLTASSVLVLLAAGALAQEPADQAEPETPYTPLGLERRAQPALLLPGDYNGVAQLGVASVSDENYMFGQYNGLEEDEVSVIGKYGFERVNGITSNEDQVMFGTSNEQDAMIEIDLIGAIRS